MHSVAELRRIKDQGGACGAAGPRQRRAQALGGPPGHTPARTTQDIQIKSASTARQAGTLHSRLLAPDCPARGHRVKGGPMGRRCAQTLDPAATHQLFGAYEKDGQE